MAQRVQQQRQTVKRIDECAREQEAREHDEMISRARRASRKARKSAEHAHNLIMEIERLV